VHSSNGFGGYKEPPPPAPPAAEATGEPELGRDLNVALLAMLRLRIVLSWLGPEATA
jgi:hypothetical protein